MACAGRDKCHRRNSTRKFNLYDISLCPPWQLAKSATYGLHTRSDVPNSQAYLLIGKLFRALSPVIARKWVVKKRRKIFLT